MGLYLKYFLDLAKYGLFISTLGGWFGTTLNRPFPEFFLLAYISVGPVGSIGLYHYFQGNEYYFFFNKGLSKARLNFAVITVNIALGLAVFSLLKTAGWL